ncbi:MAG: hypothetical protein KAT65_11870, partial [Methanophagales archaeon]|nr:hypothetical protein [Methanophagales archaeon]
MTENKHRISKIKELYSFLAQVLWYENTLLFSCLWVSHRVMKVSLERKCKVKKDENRDTRHGVVGRS